MSRISIPLGAKEYAAHKIPAFAANNLLLKIQRIILPVLGAMTGQEKGSSVFDMDLRDVAKILSEKLTPEIMGDIVMPMFEQSQVVSVTDNIKINSEANFNKVFTVDDLGDFYELVYEVLKHNYGVFFTSLPTRFGFLKSGAAAAPKSNQNVSAN